MVESLCSTIHMISFATCTASYTFIACKNEKYMRPLVARLDHLRQQRFIAADGNCGEGPEPTDPLL